MTVCRIAQASRLNRLSLQAEIGTQSVYAGLHAKLPDPAVSLTVYGGNLSGRSPRRDEQKSMADRVAS